MTKYQEASKLKHDLFFAALAKHGVVTRALELSGLSAKVTYQHRREDPEFAERWTEALEAFVDGIEQEAHRRGVLVTDKPLAYQGQLTYKYKRDADGRVARDADGVFLPELDESGAPIVVTVKEYSDSILLAMLKAKRKEYRDNSKLEITGADGGPVQVEATPTEVARDMLFLIELGMREAAKKQEAHADGADLA